MDRRLSPNSSGVKRSSKRQNRPWGISQLGKSQRAFLMSFANFKGIQLIDVYSKRRIIAVTKVEIVEWHDYKHLDWITLTKGKFLNDVLRTSFKEVSSRRRVKISTQLGVESIRRNSTPKPDAYRSNLRRQDAYTPYSDPRGFIYQNKDKKNRLMRIDELHKFSDGTLDDVRTALNDRLKGIRMKYLPQTF
ncbi:hypothetical protein Tco_0418007 [Tanacetum coccineum]